MIDVMLFEAAQRYQAVACKNMPMKGIKDWRLKCETDQEREPSYSVSWGFLRNRVEVKTFERRYQLQNFDEAVAQSRVKELFFWIPSLGTGCPTCDKIRV
jgi:hypothetical protein